MLNEMQNAFVLKSCRGFPGGSVGKEFTCSAGDVGDTGLIMGQKIPRKRACNAPQYSCLKNLMDRGAWWATVHGAAKSWTQLK